MDNWPDGIAPDVGEGVLSYDDTPYEEQLPTHPLDDHERSSLANRIGSTKVYLLSETSVARAGKFGKRKHAEEEEDTDADEDMDQDTTQRGNALLLRGPPISHLPTARLFAYAKHFDVQPMGLEWVDDNTCVLVFETKNSARLGHRHLQKAITENPDDDGFVTAKPIPIALWPPEERINSSLGKGEGLKGTIRMRWAQNDDVKKKGARKESEFYKKHGRLAGKEVYGGEGVPATKRRRGDEGQDLLEKVQLDDELDAFLKEDEEPSPASPPSKMRSDYLSTNGRTLLQRTSVLRAHPEPERLSLADRLTAPLPRRARNGALGTMHADIAPTEELGSRIWSGKLEWGHSEPVEELRSQGGRGQRRSRRGERRDERHNDRPPRHQPRKMTQQELDDEMDAFLNEKK
ncbi:hypothetical protein H0H87_002190 [Tephrocybe sp. NHM501043]|nr:hypothetical protein H0H87_002190 [Tephrocybe sp. NHM501043]